MIPISCFYVSHDPNFFTNVSPAWSRLFLISSTCVQNDFWHFCNAIKQKIEHLRSKNLQNWVFTFLNEFFFCQFASNFIFLRIARSKFFHQRIPPMKWMIFDIFNVRSKWILTFLQRNSTKNWAFEEQKPSKLSFHFFKWFFLNNLLPISYLDRAIRKNMKLESNC